MSWWATLFRDDTATWRSPQDPASAVDTIARSFPRWRFRVRSAGWSLHVAPRSRGAPLYVIDIDVTGVAGGSQIETAVHPATRSVARFAIAGAAVTALGLVLTISHAQVRLLWLDASSMLVFGFFATIVGFIQLLAMGIVRKGASKRLAWVLTTAGAMGPSPPGWYADPSRQARMRWWDGTAWTSTTHA